MSVAEVAGTAIERPTRLSTMEVRRAAVERAVRHMRASYGEPLSLHQLALVAHMSPYHLHRVFVDVTGVSPGRFLAAIRMEAAKRLLVDRQRRITDICFDVGYNSLGTFTTLFKTMVGIQPRRFRQLARGCQDIELDLRALIPDVDVTGIGQPGTIFAPDGLQGWACVGVFISRVPQGFPVSCTLAAVPGRFLIDGPVPNSAYLMATALPRWTRAIDLLIQDRDQVRVAWAPICPPSLGPRRELRLVLAPPQLTDPPLVLAAPLIIAVLHGVPFSGRHRRLPLY